MQNDVTSEAVFNVVHSYRLAMRAALKANEVGLNGMNVKCLMLIKKSKRCTANDIVGLLNRDKSQIARLIKEMIERNWIIKTANPEDKRSSFLSLTTAGEALTALITETQAQVKKQMFQGLSQQELQVFNKVSNTMTQNLKLYQPE